MSIDYYIFNFDGPPPPHDVISSRGYKSQPMGSVETVREKIARYLPQIEWGSGKKLVGYVVDKGYLIELSLTPDKDGLVYCIGVHPNGIAKAQPVMRRFCLSHGWYVHDPQKGEWIEPSELDTPKVVREPGEPEM
ncbi:MAG: hypothetical protein P8129_11520 [Anaerolineae bacterium]